MDFLIFQVPMLTLQATLDGVLLGILFALIAYGMALQWGVMNIINIAQGDLVILGGYIDKLHRLPRGDVATQSKCQRNRRIEMRPRNRSQCGN